MSAEATRSDGRRDWLLAIDTATSRIIVSAGALDGTPLGITTWVAGRTHGEQLLPAIGRLHGEANLRRSRIRGVIVGTGPGAFTGLRVGISTAKALAHELGVPIIGVSTGEALLAAAASNVTGAAVAGRSAVDATGTAGAARSRHLVLLLPAGPNDRLVVRSGEPTLLLPGGTDPEVADDDELIAIDLDGRAPAEALARGERARDGLAEALIRLGAARLAAGDVDDLARLVPEYVSLPRGVRAETGEVAWSRDHR
jgi:tRNA threonylcarbamoyl adenosine modification protein YeaZ